MLSVSRTLAWPPARELLPQCDGKLSKLIAESLPEAMLTPVEVHDVTPNHGVWCTAQGMKTEQAPRLESQATAKTRTAEVARQIRLTKGEMPMHLSILMTI